MVLGRCLIISKGRSAGVGKVSDGLGKVSDGPRKW